jgi:hypothetical protein
MSDATVARSVPPRLNFWVLMFGCCAAPIFWLGQLMLAYWASAQTCYGSDHPTRTDMPGALFSLLIAFDAISIAAALAGAIVSLMCWRAAGEGETRPRFMAIWGIFSSLCFSSAIVFETIASVTVPICAR